MVKSYISAIKAVLSMNNIKIVEDRYLLCSLVKACRLKNDVVKTRLPIQKAMLGVILKEVRQAICSSALSGKPIQSHD